MTNEIIRKAALEWIEKNTSFSISSEPLPASIELFISKYEEIMNMRSGVTSESISGLSQSFNGDIGALLKHYAIELIGEEYLNSEVRCVLAEKRWK